MLFKLSLKSALLTFALAGSAVTLLAPSKGLAADPVSQASRSQTLPAGLRLALYRTLAKQADVDYSVTKEGCATLPGQALTACFNAAGAHFSGGGSLALHLVSYGRRGTDALMPVKPVRPVIEGDRISYAYDGLSEWWRVLSVGFEQGFTLTRRPAGQGELILALAANDQPKQGRNTLSWDKLRYGGLVVTDAHGKTIPATLQSEGDRIRIAVNDTHAVYPLVVDPLVWLEQKVIAGDGAANGQFGISAAISGNTALIGSDATVDGKLAQGAVYVFTKSNGVWTQTQVFTSSDGEQYDNFGNAVALDGSTALIGANCAHYDPTTFECGPGAAYIFTESDGVWSEVQILTASDGAAYDSFGYSVALDGATALVGANGAAVNGNFSQGAAYVFDDSDGTWTQTQKLTASDGTENAAFGGAVTLEDATALIGAPFADVNDTSGQGAVYEFTQSDGTWTQGQKLTASDGETYDEFGSAIALDGAYALIGAPSADVNGNSGQGAVYEFMQSGGSWMQGQKIVANNGSANDVFGWAISLSGSHALIGAPGITFTTTNPGASYVFTKSNGTWTQEQKLTASDGMAADNFGWSVAFGNATALVGSYHAAVDGNYQQGAAYFYGASDLELALSVPGTVGQGQNYVSQTIATNNASAASPAVATTIAVPAAASFISATSTQGSCSEDVGVVTCDFGQIPGNAGMATANVTLKATGVPGTTIENTASIAKATPALSASAPTTIGESGACPAGYSEYDGQLDAGESFTTPPIEVEEAGQKYIQLDSPMSFGIFAIVTTRYGTHTYHYPHKKEGHRWGAAGTYQIGVQANSEGGNYTLCTNLNPQQ